MLIEIDDSVMMALKNENPNDEHVILSLTNLFVSSYQGYHILHASIDSLEYFSKMNLGKIAQTTIQTLIKKYSSYKSLTKNISKKLIIYKVTSKNPQKFRQIEAFSIIGQILTCK